MSRNFERVHKNSAILQEKMELSAGLGNYPKDSDISPTSEMSRSEARYVLNLLSLGFEKVNFWVSRIFILFFLNFFLDGNLLVLLKNNSV